MDKKDKIEDLEENLAMWDKQEPTCDKEISLKLKVIAGLKKDIETLMERVK